MALETPGSGNINPYAAPRSRVDDPAASPTAEPAFFPVSLLKLVLMSLATFNLYGVYWFYKNWKCVQRLDDATLNAPIRAFFYPVTSYWLFRRIREHADAEGVGGSLQAGLLAIGVFALAALWRLPDPYWLVTFLGVVPLLPVQSVVNKVNRKIAPGADTNSRLGGWNIAVLAVGGLLFVLAVIGTFLEQ